MPAVPRRPAAAAAVAALALGLAALIAAAAAGPAAADAGDDDRDVFVDEHGRMVETVDPDSADVDDDRDVFVDEHGRTVRLVNGKKGEASGRGFQLELHGYGELGAALFDHGPNANREGGAQRDLRVELDATRFVAQMVATTASGWELEAELEIEHGGTGAAREIEYEEFGEYEVELEKGGEVLLEELYLEKKLGRFRIKGGRFYVAIGHLSERYRPTQYLAATRSEVETVLLPGQWDEMGLHADARFGPVEATLQVVNGLDSSGFSSHGWISTGHQGAFETVRATDPAVVGRVDVTAARGVLVGAAGYAGGASRNRPKPDLIQDCEDPDPDVVASCGYVSAPVVLAEAHAAIDRGPVRGSALAVWGWLGHAREITERNRRLSNQAGVARTPVASQAYGLSLEAGVDIGPWVGVCKDHALEPFVRLERYDTMFRTPTGIFDNPRFARTVATVGTALTLEHVLTFKLDVSRRQFGSSALRDETTVHATAGFVY